MLRSMLIILLLFSVGALGWTYRGIWAGDPLSIPAVNDGWGSTTFKSASDKRETATFAAGCFWGVESTFRKIPGVLRTRVGYTGGTSLDPSYFQVASQRTGHAESIDIEFDPTKVSYSTLLDIFFNSHDPTAKNRSEYRSAIFYHTDYQRDLAEQKKRQLDDSGEYAGPLTTEIVPAGVFYPAEQYHQRYFESRGSNHVCRVGDGKKRRGTTQPAG
jgi:peptide-methionine (S)-S-oxide reductase